MAKGVKTGGRTKGTPNKTTSAAAKRAAEIASSGLTPLEYMLQILRDEKQDVAARMDAAHKAAPYVHPKLASVELGGKDGGPLQIQVVSFANSEDTQ